MISTDAHNLFEEKKAQLVGKANDFLHAEAVKVRAAKIQSENRALTDALNADAQAILISNARLKSLREELADNINQVKRRSHSLGWKVSSPLRAVRRMVVDPFKEKKELTKISPARKPTLKAKFHIDSPRVWSRETPQVTIRGWCFLETNESIAGIRALIGGAIYTGTYALARADLKSVFPQFPNCVKSGFKIDVNISSKDTEINLELLTATGSWENFLVISLALKDQADTEGAYEHWVKTYDTYTQTELKEIALASEALPYKPLISILIPVYNTDLRWLSEVIHSVKNQTYSQWQLCISDDQSTDPKLRPLLEQVSNEDKRIQVVFRPANGHISEASNSALALAQGDYTCLVDHDDLLSPVALSCIALEINRFPEAELIYSDEDKIDEQGNRFDPHFKPDWNPDLLTTQNYISHLSVYKTTTIKAQGGFKKGFEGSQDWDLLLRVTETLPASKIKHIPRILYHWRAAEGSTSLNLGEKNYTIISGERALMEHFLRLKKPVELLPEKGGHFRPKYSLPNHPPLVSIIIPTRNAEHLVRVCIASILARTNYPNYEIILIDNNSDSPPALAYFKELASDGIRVIGYTQPFNYSAITNFAVTEAKGEILCLLNNDIEVLEHNWLDECVAHATREEIGAVGARLYYPNMTVQHAGVITGLGGVAGHAFKGFAQHSPGTPQYRPHRLQNLSAVTAACLVVRKKVFLEANGFDETALPVAFNDVDFCLKVQALGYRNLYTPYAELIHHESLTRGPEDTPDKIVRFQNEISAIKTRWGDQLLNDPAYNPNLSLNSEDFAFAYPPRNPPLIEALKAASWLKP